MKNIRIALKQNVVRTMVIKAAYCNKWMSFEQILRSESNPYEIIFVTKPNKNTFIHYIEDFVIEVAYLWIEGEEADRVISEAENSLDCYSWSEITDEYDRAENDLQKIKAIYKAGVTAPYLKFDPECKKFFDRTLLETNPQIRTATILAMGYMSWPEWKEVLRDLQATDPDTEVCQSAFSMLESLEKFEKGELEPPQRSDTDTPKEETRTIEDLNLNVPVIVDENSINDSVRVEYKLEDNLLKEIYIVIGVDVKAEQVENSIKYLNFLQELAELLIWCDRLKKRIFEWIERHDKNGEKLDKNSLAKTIQGSIRTEINSIEHTMKQTLLLEKLEENANKFNHFGGGEGMTILGWTAKLIQEKVPEIIANCMERLDILEDEQEALDAVVDFDIEKEFSYFYNDRGHIIRGLNIIEENLKKIENNPQKGYHIKEYLH